MHVGISSKNRALVSRIRAHIPDEDRVTILHTERQLVRQCTENGIHLLFAEVVYATRSDFSEWREAGQIEDLDLVLILRIPSPEIQLRALRCGVYETISDTSYDLGDDVRRILENVRRERFPLHDREIAIRSYGEAVVSVRGKRVSLTAMEYRVLKVLLGFRGRYAPVEDIVDQVWGPGAGHKGDLYVYVSRLREKLEENPDQPRLIVSARGLGYAFLGEVAIQREFA